VTPEGARVPGTGWLLAPEPGATLGGTGSAMQRELLHQNTWDSPEQLGSAIFEWIAAWYNPRRRHTSLDMLSPIDFETLHTAANPAA
jgi:transposase InsO family protein